MPRENGQIRHSNAARTAWNAGSHPHRASPRLFGAHPGNPGSYRCEKCEDKSCAPCHARGEVETNERCGLQAQPCLHSCWYLFDQRLETRAS
jgi:hypothetical protein